MTQQELARYIDHTALRPETTEEQIRTLCDEACRYGFASVCVMPFYVPIACFLLGDLETRTLVGTTIGFPNGGHKTTVKVAEAARALRDGARELDMVLNVGGLKSGHLHVVAADIAAVVEVAHGAGAIVKVILETSLLTDDEKRLACELATGAGADFVKTSTGFSGGGATVADILLMRRAAGPDVRIKASGGIRDYPTAIEMIAAGADRIGTSASVAIVENMPGR
jgi:deoxyribose-phosphate aldolase